MIEGDALELAFDTANVRLGRFDSHGFDTGLTPVGKPIGGPIRVVNVMARRGIWDIVTCEIMSTLTMSCVDSDLLFLYAISGDSSVTMQGKERLLRTSETLIISGAIDVNAISNGQFLVSHLTRT